MSAQEMEDEAPERIEVGRVALFSILDAMERRGPGKPGLG